MDRVANSRLAGPAAVNAEHAGHSRASFLQDGAEGSFADIFAATAAGGELRQDIAALHSWITVPVGAAMTVITTPESLPDGAGLRDFALAQGFDAAAVTAIFGADEGAGSAPVTTAHALPGLRYAQEIGMSSGADIRSPLKPLFRDGSAVAMAAAATGEQALQGAAQPDLAAEVVGDGHPGLAAGTVSRHVPAEAVNSLRLDPTPGIPKGDMPVLSAEASARLTRNPDGAGGGRETGVQAPIQRLDPGPGGVRELTGARQVSVEMAQTQASAVARHSAALVSGLPGTALVPASLHALRAGWYSGSSGGASLLDGNSGSSGEGLTVDGPAALSGWAVRALGETGSGTTGTNSGAHADVLALDRLAAEAAEERLGMLIAQRMLSGIQRGEWQIRLLLRPESLGEVEIQMRLQGGALEAQLSAAQESTKELLNQGLDRLREYFQRSGMEVAYLGVSAQSKGGGDGKPTGQSAGLAVKPEENSIEEEGSSSPNSPVAGQSGSQWDMFV